MQNNNLLKLQENNFAELCGRWDFTSIIGEIVEDISGHDHALYSVGEPQFLMDPNGNGSVRLDGSSQGLSSKSPVVRTDKSFSVSVWVKLDGELLDSELNLPENHNALTAITQNSEIHGGFYLGLRKYKGGRGDIYRWCFALAPITMDMPGIHASSHNLLSKSDLGKWFFLVAVSDAENRCVQLHIPQLKEYQSTPMQDHWKLWSAEGGFQVGIAQWDRQIVDQWPGYIGSIRAYNGVLSFEQSEWLFRNDLATR